MVKINLISKCNAQFSIATVECVRRRGSPKISLLYLAGFCPSKQLVEYEEMKKIGWVRCAPTFFVAFDCEIFSKMDF